MTLPKTFTEGEILTAADVNDALKHVEGAHGTGVVSGATGEVVITHGLGYTPGQVILQVARPNSGSDDVARLAGLVVWAVSATTFTVRSYRRDTNVSFSNNSVGFYWIAR